MTSLTELSRTGSLAGVTVVEIGTSVAAPFAGQVLGDLGAEVIKVERLGSGDDSRSWAPPSWDGASITFLGLNQVQHRQQCRPRLRVLVDDLLRERASFLIK